jgi:hypothetical protein
MMSCRRAYAGNRDPLAPKIDSALVRVAMSFLVLQAFVGIVILVLKYDWKDFVWSGALLAMLKLTS